MESEQSDQPGFAEAQAQVHQKDSSLGKSRRKWLRRALVVVMVLVVMAVVLVALAPTIASTNWGGRRILGLINDRIAGQVQVDELSVSWFQPGEIKGLSVRDPQNREAVFVESLLLSKGLMKSVSAMTDLGQIEIHGSKIELFVDEQGRLSLAQAFASPEPSDDVEEDVNATTNWPSGKVIVKNAAVTLHAADGRSHQYSIPEMNAQITADRKLDASANVVFPDRETIQLTASVKDMSEIGTVDWAAMDMKGLAGELNLQSSGPVDLAIVDAVTGGGIQMTGRVSPSIRLTLAAGQLDGHIEMGLIDVSSGPMSGAIRQPVNLVVTADLQSTHQSVGGEVQLDGDFGLVKGRFRFPLKSEVDWPEINDAVERLLAGKSFGTPDLELDAQGEIDLSALAEAVPSALHIRENCSIKSGDLTIHELAIRGGSTPSIKMAVRVDELSGVTGGRQVQCQPMIMEIDAGIDGSQGPVLSRGVVETGFARIESSGDTKRLNAEFSGDLRSALDQLGAFFEIDLDAIEGNLAGKIEATRMEGDRLAIRSDVTVDRYLSARSDARVRADRIQLIENAVIEFDDAKEIVGVTGDWRVAVDGLAASTNDGAAVRPVHLAVGGDIRSDASRIAGNAKVTGDLGLLSVEYDLPNDASVMTRRDVSNLLAGRRMELPDAMFKASGQIDVAALSNALPALMNQREGTTITSGALVLHRLNVTGGSQPGVDLAVRVDDVVGTSQVAAIALEPMNLELNAEVQVDGLRLTLLDLGSPFLQVDGSGDVNSVQVNVNGNLEQLFAQVGQLVDLGVDHLEGTIQADLQLARQDDDKVSLSGDAGVQNFVFQAGGRSIHWPAATISHRGSIRIAGGQTLERIETERATINIDEQVDAQARGWFQFSDGGFDFVIDVNRANLEFLNQSLAAFEIDAKLPDSGSAKIKATAQREAGGSIITSGQLSAESIAMKGRTVAPTLDAKWSDANLNLVTSTVEFPEFVLRSDAVNFRAAGFRAQYAPATAVSGHVTADANLENLTTVLASLGDAVPANQYAGRINLDAECLTAGTDLTLRGTAKVRDFSTGDASLPPQSADIRYDAAIDTESRKIQLTDLLVNGEPLSMQLKGRIDDYSGTANLDLSGTYELQWDKVMALVEQWSPGSTSELKVKGRERGRIQLKGPAYREGATPVFRELTGTMTTGWDSATAYGIELGKLEMSVRLADGQIELPPTSVTAIGGRINLAGAVDLRGDTPVLRLPQDLKLVEGVSVTPAVADHFLSRINPVFGKATRVEGNVDVVMVKTALPLNERIRTAGSGLGQLRLTDFRIQPGGTLHRLLQLAGQGRREMYTVNVSGVRFLIRDGRLQYKNLTMRFVENKFDLKFSGSVGFDDTVDLVCSIPVGPALLEELNVGASALRFANMVGDTRIDIPISGTRDDPIIDLKKIDTSSLLRQILRGGNKDGDGDGVRGLLDRIPRRDRDR